MHMNKYSKAYIMLEKLYKREYNTVRKSKVLD